MARTQARKEKMKLPSPFEMLPAVTDALKAITDNPDGGTLILRDEVTGEETVRFTMPPLKERNK
jgi:hypothetical protein